MIGIGKRPLIREKIKERRREEVYSSIENIENLILNRDKLATKIMRSKLSNVDCSDDLKEFKKLQNSIDELLLKNGFSKNYLSNYFVCEKCKDTGYFNGTVCSCIMHDLVEDRVLLWTILFWKKWCRKDIFFFSNGKLHVG